MFRNVTGWPCATCGSTRASIELLHGDLARALACNPLMALLLIASPVIAAAWLVRRMQGRSRQSGLAVPGSKSLLTRPWFVLALLGVLSLNWAYVILAERVRENDRGPQDSAHRTADVVVQPANSVAE